MLSFDIFSLLKCPSLLVQILIHFHFCLASCIVLYSQSFAIMPLHIVHFWWWSTLSNKCVANSFVLCFEVPTQEESKWRLWFFWTWVIDIHPPCPLSFMIAMIHLALLDPICQCQQCNACDLLVPPWWHLFQALAQAHHVNLPSSLCIWWISLDVATRECWPLRLLF